MIEMQRMGKVLTRLMLMKAMVATEKKMATHTVTEITTLMVFRAKV